MPLYNTSSIFICHALQIFWCFPVGYCCMLNQAHARDGQGSSWDKDSTGSGARALRVISNTLIIYLEGKKPFFSSFKNEVLMERGIWKYLGVFLPFSFMLCHGIDAQGTSAQ